MYKYGTIIHKTREFIRHANREKAEDTNNRFEEVMGLNDLTTQEHRDKIQAMIEDNHANPVNSLEDYPLTDYMKRQPRMDLRNKNFNFEEFHRYT